MRTGSVGRDVRSRRDHRPHETTTRSAFGTESANCSHPRIDRWSRNNPPFHVVGARRGERVGVDGSRELATTSDHFKAHAGPRAVRDVVREIDAEVRAFVQDLLGDRRDPRCCIFCRRRLNRPLRQPTSQHMRLCMRSRDVNLQREEQFEERW